MDSPMHTAPATAWRRWRRNQGASRRSGLRPPAGASPASRAARPRFRELNQSANILPRCAGRPAGRRRCGRRRPRHLGREQLGVEAIQAGGHGVEAELPTDDPARIAHAAGKGRVAEQERDALGQLKLVLRGDEQPVAAVPDQVRDAAHAAGHDRSAGGHCLDQHAAHALVQRGQHEEVEEGHDRAHVLPPAEEVHAVPVPGERGLGAERPFQLTAADEDQVHVRVLLPHPRHGVEQVLRPLDRQQPADEPDEAAVGIEPECALAFRRVGRRLGKGADVDPAVDRADRLRPTDRELHVVPALAAGQRHRAIGAAGKPAFEGQEQRRPEPPEVPGEHVTVRGVDHARDPRQPCGQAAEDAGLGGVGVDEVGPLAPDDPPQAQQRDQVPDRVNAAHERAHRDEAGPALAGRVFELIDGRLLGLRHAAFARQAVHEHGLVAVGELAAGQERVLRGAAHVQAGEDVQDFGHGGMSSRAYGHDHASASGFRAQASNDGPDDHPAWLIRKTSPRHAATAMISRHAASAPLRPYA